MTMTVLIAGGGTGGHLFPGIALAQELTSRAPETEVVFVGTERGIETRAVPKAGFELELLPVSGLRRTGLLGMARGLARLPIAMLRAMSLIRRRSPDVAVSVGGYAAGPAVLAAKLMGVPCVVMEQNAVPGFTNKILGRLVDRVFASLPTQGFPSGKVLVLGNPVRADFLPVRDEVYEAQEPLRILVFGGSQGARALNEVWVEIAPRLSELGWSVTHQTGKADAERVAAAYRAGGATVAVLPFIDDMADAYRNADLVVCRSGASTIAELTVCGRPSILVPFPFAVDDHQSANAQVLAQAGGAIHVPQSELSAERLIREIQALGPARLAAMASAARAQGKPSAVRDIADALQEVSRV